jgi:hypothetical protein
MYNSLKYKLKNGFYAGWLSMEPTARCWKSKFWVVHFSGPPGHRKDGDSRI